MSTESVKIKTDTVDKVRKIVKKSGQTIGAFATIAIDAAAEKEIKKLKIK